MKVVTPSDYVQVGLWLQDKTFYSQARQCEIIDANVKAPHNCDWTLTVQV